MQPIIQLRGALCKSQFASATAVSNGQLKNLALGNFGERCGSLVVHTDSHYRKGQNGSGTAHYEPSPTHISPTAHSVCLDRPMSGCCSADSDLPTIWSSCDVSAAEVAVPGCAHHCQHRRRGDITWPVTESKLKAQRL